MNPIFLSKQLKDNAVDLQEYTKDLQRWGEEMKRKEDTLKGKVEQVEPKKKQKTVQPESKSETKPKKLEPEYVLQLNSIKTPITKIGITDYSAWDKFDVDAELNKLDLETDSEFSDEQNTGLEEAALEKEKGNEFVKKRQWDEALECYSKAIKLHPWDPIYYANRALCYLKKNMYKETEQDCTCAVKLDNTYAKAYHRRATARVALGDLESAKEDYLKVLQIEPKNSETLRDLELLLRKKYNDTNKNKLANATEQRPVSKFTMSRNPSKTTAISKLREQQTALGDRIIDKGKPNVTWQDDDDIIVVKPISKPPRLRSQKPLKRIKIVDISEQVKLEQMAEPVSSVIERQPQPDGSKENISSRESPRIINEFKKHMGDLLSPQQTAWPKPDSSSLNINSDDFIIVERKVPEKNEQNTCNINGLNNIKKDSEKTDFVPPRNSVQFYSTWKNLKSSEERFKYLYQIDPVKFPKIFSNSLDSDVFSNIIEVLTKHSADNRERIYDILKNFTEVRRFSMITMFLTAEDKNNLWKLFNYLRGAEVKKDVDHLIQKYEL